MHQPQCGVGVTHTASCARKEAERPARCRARVPVLPSVVMDARNVTTLPSRRCSPTCGIGSGAHTMRPPLHCRAARHTLPHHISAQSCLTRPLTPPRGGTPMDWSHAMCSKRSPLEVSGVVFGLVNGHTQPARATSRPRVAHAHCPSRKQLGHTNTGVVCIPQPALRTVARTELPRAAAPVQFVFSCAAAPAATAAVLMGALSVGVPVAVPHASVCVSAPAASSATAAAVNCATCQCTEAELGSADTARAHSRAALPPRAALSCACAPPLGSAPRRSRQRTSAASCALTASRSTERPSAVTAHTSAPFNASSSRASMQPFAAAQCAAVQPSSSRASTSAPAVKQQPHAIAAHAARCRQRT